jgi:RES domain-containing protein
VADETLTLWRAFVPRWAHAPLSGKGAARFGGRWNPVGEPTIYAALELSTAWAEYNQGFVQHPALIACLTLEGATVADLREDAVLANFGASPAVHETEWRDCLDRDEEPATHRLRKALLEAGFHAALYPSFMSRGGTCIALWRWNAADAPKLSVIDPDRRLPVSQASWL